MRQAEIRSRKVSLVRTVENDQALFDSALLPITPRYPTSRPDRSK